MKKNYFENRTKGTRLVSFLLALSLIGSLFPAWAFAEGEQYGLKDLATAIQEAPTATSGDGWDTHAKSYALNSTDSSFRMFIEYMNWRGSTPPTTIKQLGDFLDSENITVGGIPRQTTFYVYAEEGEVICLGSSVYNSQLKADHTFNGTSKDNGKPTGCDIVLTTPSGTAVAIDVEENGKGHIKTRAQEIAGPKLNSGNTNGYTPVTYVAPETGEYTVVFHPETGRVADGSNFSSNSTPNENLRISKCTNFSTLKQKYLVAAWDITVVSADYTAVQPARTWAKYLSIANSTMNGATSDLNTYVLTKDGYIYHVNFREVDPAGFIFFSNNTGFTTNGETKYSLYHSFYDNDNSLRNITSHEYVTMHYPDTPDTDTMITHRIFFENPEFLEANDSSIKQEPQPVANITNVNFAGAKAGIFEEGQGGVFTFQSDHPTNAHIVIDFRQQIQELDKVYGAELAWYAEQPKFRDQFATLFEDWKPDQHEAEHPKDPDTGEEISLENEWTPSLITYLDDLMYMHTRLHEYLQEKGSGMVELNGPAVQGHNTFYWDGYDTIGKILPPGLFEGTQIHVSTEAKQGEIHFPMMDVENLGGITIQRLNSAAANWDGKDAYNVAFNNTPMTVKGTIEPDVGAGTPDSQNASYYLLSDNTRTYYPGRKGSITSPVSTLTVDSAKDIAQREYKDYDTKNDKEKAEILAEIQREINEYGKTYHHVPVSSEGGIMSFSGDFGDRSGIDIWASYTDGAHPHESTQDFAVVRANTGTCKISGTVFYDANQNSTYETQTGSQDYGLRDVKVRLMHEVKEVDADGKLTSNQVWVPLMHTVRLPKMSATGGFIKVGGRVQYEDQTVEYITVTNAQGAYTFTSVPDGTYAIQVLLDDVQKQVLEYVPSTAANKVYGANRGTYGIKGTTIAPDGNKVTLQSVNVDNNTTTETKVTYTEFAKGGTKPTVYYMDPSTPMVDTDHIDKNYIREYAPDDFTCFDSGNMQTRTVSKQSSATKNKTFDSIGYFTGVPQNHLKSYTVEKNWKDNISSQPSITMKMYVYDPAQADDAVGIAMGHGKNYRTGNEVGSVVLSASNGWSHTWNNLDDRNAYYFEEFYSKRDTSGKVIYEQVYDPITHLESVQEHLVLIGCTMPVYSDEATALAANENRLLYAKLEGDHSASKDYLTIGNDNDSKEGIFVSFFGAKNKHTGDTGDTTKAEEAYVYHDSTSEMEKQTAPDANAMLYDMTYTLTEDGTRGKVLTMTNSQTFDERQYYVWLGHETELPDFITKTSFNASGEKTTSTIEMQKCDDPNHEHNSAGHLGGATNESHIVGLTISSLDAAETAFQEGNSTDSFHFDRKLGTAVKFTANKSIYHTGTGTRTYRCEYTTFNQNVTQIQVKDKDGTTRTVTIQNVPEWNGGDNYEGTKGYTVGAPVPVHAASNGVGIMDGRVQTTLTTYILTNEKDSNGKPVYLEVPVADYPEYFTTYTWTMTIHVYDVQPDGIFEYDPTRPMVLQSSLGKNGYLTWDKIQVDNDDEDAIRYYSNDSRAYGRIDTVNPDTDVTELIHHLIAVDEKGQNVLLDNKDRAGLFGRSIPVYGLCTNEKDAQGNPISVPYKDKDGNEISGKPIVDENGNFLTREQYQQLLTGDNAPPITIASTKDTIRVPRYKKAVNQMMSTCADLVGIAHAGEQPVSDEDAQQLTYYDTYQTKHPTVTGAKDTRQGGIGGDGFAEANGVGGKVRVQYDAGKGRQNGSSNPEGQYQDHLNYATVTFVPNGNLSNKQDDTFYYKIVVYAEDYSTESTQSYGELDATQGVEMYTYFTMRPKEIDAAIAGATLSLGGDTIDLNYYVSGVTDDEGAAHQVDVKNYYMSFTSGGTDLLVGKSDTVGTIKDSDGQTISLQRFDPARNLVMDNTWDDTRTERLYAYTYTDLYAYQMSDPVTATLYYDSGDGFVKISQQTYSVKEYAEDVLKAQTLVEEDGGEVLDSGRYIEEVAGEKNQYDHSAIGDLLQNMLVDLLNYGAAAQAYTGNNEENLANSSFSDLLKGQASETDGLNQFVMDKGEEDNAITIVGAQLILSEGMTNDLRFTFTLKDASQKENYTLRISTPDALYLEALRPEKLAGGTIATLNLKDCEEVRVDEDGVETYRVTIENIPSFYWSTPFTVAFYKNAEMVHSVSYSVNAYCNRVANSEGTEPVDPAEADRKLKDLLLAMYNYGGSSRVWFLSEEDYKPVFGNLGNNVSGHDPLQQKADGGEQA